MYSYIDKNIVCKNIAKILLYGYLPGRVEQLLVISIADDPLQPDRK